MTQQDSMLVVAKGKFQSTGTIDLFSASTLPLSLSTASGSRTIQAVFVDTYPEDPLPTQTAQSAPYVLLAVAPYQQKAQFDLLDAPTSLGLTFRSATPRPDRVGTGGHPAGGGLCRPVYHVQPV